MEDGKVLYLAGFAAPRYVVGNAVRVTVDGRDLGLVPLISSRGTPLAGMLSHPDTERVVRVLIDDPGAAHEVSLEWRTQIDGSAPQVFRMTSRREAGARNDWRRVEP